MLTLPLSVSVWLHDAGADLGGARAALLDLRGALLAGSGLDARSEPVPLQAGDERTVVLHLAVYLHGLVVRAATARARSAAAAERAVGVLGGARRSGLTGPVRAVDVRR